MCFLYWPFWPVVLLAIGHLETASVTDCITWVLYYPQAIHVNIRVSNVISSVSCFLGKSNNPNSPDYVPSVFPHKQNKTPQKKKRESDMARYERSVERSRKKIKLDQTSLTSSTTVTTPCDEPATETVDSREDSSQNLTPNEQPECHICKDHILSLEMECRSLRAENLKLKEIIKSVSFDEMTFQDNDDKVKVMTGLPSYEKLMTVFRFVCPYLKKQSNLSCFQQFIMTLLRMRLNLSLDFFGYLFNIHASTASRLFNNTIDVMYNRLVPALVFWPDRQELRESLPMCFRRAFKSCASIIDCFEIFIERPGTLRARAQTYSQYKHHNTMKYLIGVTPQGTISFISKGWGGRTSDKEITESSGYLNNILPGDTILADRGFDVGETVGLFNAKLQIPAFTKGRKQLCPMEIESTRGLASVRIHVERVIGVVRQKYTMLQSIISIPLCVPQKKDEPMPLDKIVSICCALTNVCSSVVPSE